MAIIKIPKKKTSSPNVKEKRKAGTRAGLTKPAIAAAAKLIESAGANGFSLRKLAKGLCHVAVPRARSVGASGIVRPPRLPSATCPLPRREACGGRCHVGQK